MTDTRPTLLDSIPLTGMRGAIARHMMASVQSTAQLTLHRTVTAEALKEFRASLHEHRQFAFVTYNDLLLLAVARVLPDHPALNATLEAATIHRWRSVNIGVAVAVENGVMVPVVKEAQTKSLLDIGAEMRTLSERAREGRLGKADITDATFTVTNLGPFGVDSFTPILNLPQVAVLGVGCIRSDATMTLSLTIDHRAVDGAPGGLFLQALSQVLEEPSHLVLDAPSCGS